jgi:hypothetical protein
MRSIKNSIRFFDINKLHKLSNLSGLDFHIFSTLVFRGWNVIAGGVTIILLPLFLNPSDQGYYFTFASVLALQIFFELGLNQILIQLVSHEVANLSEADDGFFEGSEFHLGRLSSLARLMRSWYSVAALLFALIGGGVGIIFFGLKNTAPISHWVGIWVLLVIATAFNLRLSPGLALMEGCGKVGQVARLRLVQSFLGYVSFWAILFAGMGLWSIVAMPIASAICTSYWLKTHGNLMSWLSKHPANQKNQLRWKADIFPLQWRIAVSWMSGYLIFNLFTPIVFMHQGAIEAGRLGMALTIFGAISTVGMSWVNAKAPNFTMLIARQERRTLNNLFISVFIRSTIFIGVASIGIVSVVWYLDQIGVQEVKRIAPANILAILAITTTLNSIIFSMATYMRAHREEPMLMQSVVVGLLASAAIYFGSNNSQFVMVSLYMLVCLFIALPWATWLFSKYWNN